MKIIRKWRNFAKFCRKMRNSLTEFWRNIEVWAVQKHVNLVDLVKRFPTNIFLQNLASIQERTSPIKFAHLAEKSEKGSISNLSTKVRSPERAAHAFASSRTSPLRTARSPPRGGRIASATSSWSLTSWRWTPRPTRSSCRPSSSSSPGPTAFPRSPSRRSSTRCWRRCPFSAELKGSIGEGPNHSNFSHQSSVKILSKFRNFR